MSAQFTPGPWQVNHSDPEQVCDSDGEGRGCAPIAVMAGPQKGRRANARLIAAAPDLLEALRRLLEIIREEGCIAEHDARMYSLEAAEAAIAAATGETHE